MRSRNAFTVFAALLLLIGLSQTINAQNWIHLGDKHVDGNSDHDKISLGSSERTFRQLQIRVDDAAVNFEYEKANYGSKRPTVRLYGR